MGVKNTDAMDAIREAEMMTTPMTSLHACALYTFEALLLSAGLLRENEPLSASAPLTRAQLTSLLQHYPMEETAVLEDWLMDAWETLDMLKEFLGEKITQRIIHAQ